MKKVTLFANATIASTMVATAIAAPALAWHPVGNINKSVQDMTTKSAVEDANDESSALAVNSGDTLLYTITVNNTGAADSNGYNDLANVVITDTLPSGLQLVGASQTTLSDQLGTIKPGESKTKTYTVKVTDTKDGDIIANSACFTGNSTAGDSPQTKCDKAIVKVHAPSTPAPTPTPTPSTPQTPAPSLPNTGSTGLSAALLVVGAAALGYVLSLLRLKLHRNV